MSMWKMSHVFGLRSSRNPRKRQIGTIGVYCVWGHPRSLISDDLQVNMQCQRSYVFMCWPKSCIISPFLLMLAGHVVENTIFLKTSRRLYLLWRHSLVTWFDPVFFLLKVAQMMSHKLCKISARSTPQLGGHFRKTHGASPSARERVNLLEHAKNEQKLYLVSHEMNEMSK